MTSVRKAGWQESWLGRTYQKRVRQNRDLVVVVSDRENNRGTGKTTASIQLGDRMDRTDEGLIAEKCQIDPHALREAYIEQPKGSALILDEAEVGVSKYDAATKVSQALKELISMGRIKEKYVIVNLPRRTILTATSKRWPTLGS